MSAAHLTAVLRAGMWIDYFVVMPALARISWRAALWWGRRRGDLVFYFKRGARRATIENLLHAHGGTLTVREARRIARRCFRTRTCEEAESFFFSALTPANFGSFVHVKGQLQLEQALGRGRGVILFSSHYGSVCLAMIALAHLGYKVNVVARSIAEKDNPLQPAVRRYAARKVAHLERVMGRPFIIAGAPDAMREVRGALSRGEIVYILLSVPPELAHHRARVRFLGHAADLPSGVEFLARTTGAPLVPFTVRRNPDDLTHTLSIGSEVPGPEVGEGVLQRCVDAVEREIRADPSQFFMWEFARNFWVGEPAVEPATEPPPAAWDSTSGAPE